jgi:hypothetical protein
MNYLLFITYICSNFTDEYTPEVILSSILALISVSLITSPIFMLAGPYTTGPYTKIVTGCANKDK